VARLGGGEYVIFLPEVADNINDELKIDRSFVCDIKNAQNDAVIVDTIVSLARHLNLAVVAEGVETKEQLDYLIECGYSGFQGYYFAHPVPGNKINLITKVSKLISNNDKLIIN
jgi:EAL domain-containing protein (putative c-di-GMP-specific phosphodiesterase class I)